MADIWRERGGLAPALAALRDGPPDDKLHAAKALGELVRDRGAAEALAQGGVVRPLLQVFQREELTEDDKAKVGAALHAIVDASQDIAAELVATYTDPELRVAFAAIFYSGRLLESTVTRANLLKAGVAKGLVAALSHDSEDRRAGAAYVVGVAPNAELRSALRSAGVVPAMMRLIRTDSASSPQSQSCGGFGRSVTWEARLGPNEDQIVKLRADGPWLACFALKDFCKTIPGVALEIAATPHPAAAILSCLKQHTGEAAVAPAGLLHVLFQKLEEGPLKRIMRQELLAEGFPALVPSLVTADVPDLAAHAMSTLFAMFETLGYNCLSLATAERIMTAFEQFLASEAAGAGGEAPDLAVLLLNQMALQCCPPQLELSRRRLPDNAIRNAARLLTSGKEGTGALGALPLVMTQIKQDKDSFQAEAAGRAGQPSGEPGRRKALPLAVSGGFIPGVLHMMNWVGLATFSPEVLEGTTAQRASARERATAQGIGRLGGTDEAETTARLRTLVWGAVAEILWPCRESYTMEAVECGLLAEIKACIRSGEAVAQRFVLLILPRLCCVPRAVKKLREEGIMPKLLLDLADSPHPEVLEIFQRTVADLRTRSIAVAAEGALAGMLELISAGLVQRLRQARKRRFRQDPALGDKLKATIAQVEALAREYASAIVQFTRTKAQDEQGIVPARKKEGRRQLPRSVAPSGSGSTSEGRQLPSTQPSQQEVAESGGKPARRKRSAGGKQRRVCSHCGKSGGDGVKLQACARCQDVLYCGRECQTSHWPSHKPECKPKQPKPEN